VAAEWLMTGTNTGSFNGLPPTGKRVSLPGADFVRVDGDKIRSVQGYLNAGALPVALGLDVSVQPKAIGPFSFGTSVRAYGGSAATPGAFSITVLEARSEEEKKAIADSGRQIATEMLGMPGFVGWIGATIGDRMITVTAWETPDDPRQLLHFLQSCPPPGGVARFSGGAPGSQFLSTGFRASWNCTSGKPEI
jgi:hypothetical protein